MKTPRPSDIQTYDQFVTAMEDPKFSFNMHYGLQIMTDAIEQQNLEIEGDDLRLSKFWLKYQHEKQHRNEH